MYPKNNLSYVGNFMHMMWGVPAEEYEVDPIIESALNKLFILPQITSRTAQPRRFAWSVLPKPTCTAASAGVSALNHFTAERTKR